MVKISAGKKTTGSWEIHFLTEEQSKRVPSFEGKKTEIAVRHEPEKTCIYCGIGKAGTAAAEVMRNQAAGGIRQAMKLKAPEISLIDPAEEPDAPSLPKGSSSKEASSREASSQEASAIPDESAVIAAVEGAALSAYAFSRYRSEKPDELKSLKLISSRITGKKIAHIGGICEGVFLARDLVNDNAHEVTPEGLAAEARAIAKGSPEITCTVLDEKQIDKKKLGLIRAVGQGSEYPPRLILIRYSGNPKSSDLTAVIGKGVTFDTGGLNMKPSSSIETMRTDMAGAAAVLGLMKSLTLLKPKVNVLGVIPAVQSAVGPKSFFPGDIYRSFSGKTVEIKNTDAEGRLILADALSYCVKEFSPVRIVDLATLTGAIIVSLGDLYGGLFSNDEKLASDLIRAGMATGEKLWPMPLDEEHMESVKGELSDIINTSKLPPRHAGSSTAAAFIKTFLDEEIPWAHLDIAGTAYNEREPRGIFPKFATGFGVRLLLDFLAGGK